MIRALSGFAGRMLPVAALTGGALAAACTPVARDDLTRAAARNAIRPIIAERFPGVPLEPGIDCLIDNASSDELLALGADSITGPTAATQQIVLTIAARPETINCLATDGLNAFLR
ncbi:hypothetical protein [Profundibacterium mesophilum]|uniref:Prokaryotic membrane lipoprotein lipid attachment site domain containing protein n=1 Tax=Profundibacterium mesophilum KAUST100406-0324 TaxID=1037889 RepID=A0A921NXS3_9RHOB|nr:hypothetical protein [Profundibacterium mesophilum]KAF0677335.1 Prokaryotic membrane lipoprotein lipid attachment site domain containing protein [Profundibacterium mesophilum KAUST100406-0324]